MLTKNAIGNLINRYKAVLKKCHLLNTFGSLALASMFALGGSLAMPMQAGAAYEPTLDNLNPAGGSDASAYKVKVINDPRDTGYLTTFSTIENGVAVHYGVSFAGTGRTSIDNPDMEYTSITQVTSYDPHTFTMVDPNGSNETLYFAVTKPDGGVFTQTPSTGIVLNTYKDQNFIGITTINDTSPVTMPHPIFPTGDFIYNSNTSDAAVTGGAVYNNADGNKIFGDFLNNSAVSTGATAQGGAVYNVKLLNSITGDFLNNRASGINGASGGAIFSALGSEIDIITGDFINNSAISTNGSAHGGAIDVGTIDAGGQINTITGNFINNSASGARDDSYIVGGAIYSRGNITTINGSFMNNRAIATGTSEANGGAYSGYGSTINGSFINNSAVAAGADKAYGGAIWTNGNLNFLANGTSPNFFSGNFTSNAGTIDYNAIYIDGANTLTFTMANEGDFVFNDNIRAGGAYTVDITGADASKNIFALNNVWHGAGTVNLTNATLALGEFTHADNVTYTGSIGNAALNVKGVSSLSSSIESRISFNGAVSIADTATLNVTGNNLFFAGTLTNNGTLNHASGGMYVNKIDNKGTLNISGGQASLNDITTWGTINLNSGNLTLEGTGGNIGTLNVTGGTLIIGGTNAWATTADLDTTAGTLKINSGATLNISDDKLTSNLTDFGTVTLNGYDATFVEASTMAGTLQGLASSELELKTGLTDITYLDNYNALIAEIAGSISSYNGAISIEGYAQYLSLSSIIADTNMPTETVAAGDYSHSVTSTFAGIVENRNGTKDSSISGGGTLNLTGNNNTALSVGNISVTNGFLNLGYDGADATQGGTLNGDLIVDGSNAHTGSHGTNVTITGETKVLNGGEIVVGPGSTFTSTGAMTVSGAGSQVTFYGSADLSSLTMESQGHFGAGGQATVDNLKLGGTVSIAGVGTLLASNISNTAAVSIQDDVASGGNLTLAANGTWNAGASVTLTESNFTLADSSSMNMGSHTLTTAANGKIKMENNATLTLTLSNVGSIPATNVFAKGTFITDDSFTATDNTAKVNLTGYSGTLGEFDYLNIINDIQDYLFLDANGAVSLLGVTVEAQSLSGVNSAWDRATKSLMAGNLTYPGTTTISHITKNTHVAAIGNNSTISGAGVNLTLTGQSTPSPFDISPGDISVENDASLTIDLNNSSQAQSIFGNVTLNNADLIIKRGHVKVADHMTFSMSGTSQLNISDGGTFEIVDPNAYEVNVNSFSAQAGDGKISMNNGSFSVANLKLTGGGDLTLGNGTLQGIQTVLDADTTLKSGTLKVSSLIGHGALTVDGVGSVLEAHGTTTQKLTITNGTLYVDALTLTAGAEIFIDTGGTLQVASNATLKIEGQQLTANMKDFGTVTLSGDSYRFVNFSDNGASVASFLEGDAATTVVLNAGDASNPILLDNFDEMLAALKQDLFATSSSFNITNLTINGYGQYQSLSTINVATDDPTEVVAAGDYSHNGTSTFAGIVADRHGNKDSSISGGGTLNLTADGGQYLSTGNIDVIDGILNLGTATNNGTIDGNLAIQDKGTVNVQNDVWAKAITMTQSSGLKVGAGKILSSASSVALQGGSLNLGNKTGMLHAEGFTNNTADLILETGTLQTTKGMTSTKAFTVGANGIFDLASGNADFSGITFSANTGSTLNSATGTILTVDHATIGIGDDGLASGVAATVSGATVTALLGTVNITGFTVSSISYGTDYDALVAAGRKAYGDNASLNFVGLTVDASSLTLSTVKNNDYLPNNVVLGDKGTEADGVFAAGRTATIGSVDGNAVNKGTLTLTGVNGTLVQGNLTNENTVNLGTGSITGTFSNTSTANITAHVTANATTSTGTGNAFNVKSGASFTGTSFTADSNSTITVDGGGTFMVNGNTTLGGGTLKISNASGNSIQSASASFLHNLPNDIDGKIALGAGSYAVLGGNATSNGHTYVVGVFGESGQNWGTGATAALVIVNPQTLDVTNGSIHVDGKNAASTVAVNNATFAANSILMVDAAGLNGGTALTANGGLLTVADSAKLHITNAISGSTVNIVSGFTSGSIADGGWEGDNLTSSTGLQIAQVVDFNPTVGTYSVKITGSAADQIQKDFPEMQGGSAGLMAELAKVYDVNSQEESIRFFSVLMDDTSGIGRNNPTEAAKILESVLQIAQTGAASGMSMGASFTAANNIIAYLSQAGFNLASSGGQGPAVVQVGEAGTLSGIAAGSDNASSIKNGMALWVAPMYKYSSVAGVSAGAFEHGYKSSLGGLSLGGDYTIDNTYRIGLAFNLGTGYAESTGDLSQTYNNFDFWGLSLYGAYYKENFSLMADIGFTSTQGSFAQEVSSILGVSSVEAHTQSTTWTVGLTAEYTFNTSYMDITPHAGIRYMHVHTGAYDTEDSRGVVAQTEGDSQSIWSFPVGVTLSKDFTSESNWIFTPRVDLGFIASAGDLHSTSVSSIPGVSGSSEYTMQNVDGFAFNGGLGFDLANADNGITLSLNYNLQASKHETGHMLSAMFRYDF